MIYKLLLFYPIPVLLPPGEVHPRKSIHHLRHFHSHHNLLSLAQPSSSSSRLHDQDTHSQDRRVTLGSTLSFSLGGGAGGGGGAGSCSSLSGSTESSSSIWVRQATQEEGKTSNFWDFFTGKGSSSETVV